MYVKVHRGANVGSDHHLPLAKVRLKLRATPTIKQRHKVFDVNKLCAPEVKREFTVELRNRFSALEHEMEKTMALLKQHGGNIVRV